MIKFLLITFLVCYILFKVGGYLFKLFFLNMAKKHQQAFNNSQQQRGYQSTRKGNINIVIPKDKNGTAKKSREFKGGEYVDYEEVK